MESAIKALIHRCPFIKKYAGGVSTQILLSVTSFVISTWIARVSDKEEFGLYSLAVNTVLIFMNLQNAMVHSPLTVLLPEQKGEDREILLFGLGVGQWLVVLPAVLLLAVTAIVYARITDGAVRITWVFALLLAIPADWMREFQRVVFFCDLSVNRVVRLDVVYVVVILAGMLALAGLGIMSTFTVMLLIGVGYLISAAYGYHLSGVPSKRGKIRWIATAFSRTWKYSRWALVGIIASSIQINAHVYLISALAGLENTADVSASRMLLVPFGLLISSSQRIFLASGANQRNHLGIRGFSRFFLPFLIFFTAAWVVYVTALAILHRVLILFLFTGKYMNIRSYLPLWSLLFLITAWRFTVTYSLQVLKEFKSLALFGLASATAVLLSTFLLIRSVGVAGMIYALIAGEVVLLVLSVPRLVMCMAAKEPA